MSLQKVLIIGPDMQYPVNIIKGFNLEDCLIIGDGKRDITDEDWDSLAGKIDSNTQIHLLAHGNISESGFVMGFVQGEDKSSAIKSIFKKLAELSCDQPLQVALHSCYSGAAAPQVTSLPNGSVLFMHAPADNSVIGSAGLNIIQNYLIPPLTYEHPAQLYQLFLNNLAINLSGRGAGIAVNQNGTCKSLSLETNVKIFQSGIVPYVLYATSQVGDFYESISAGFKKYSASSDINKFFQDKLSIPENPIVDEQDLLMASFIASAGEDSLESLEYFSANIDVNAQHRGDSALGSAALEGYIENVKFLLAKGADVNAKSWGVTPLHKVVYGCAYEMVKLLLEHGAQVDEKSNTGLTSLMIAVDLGEEKILDLLLVNGANSNVKDADGNTPLVTATLNGQKAMVETLLKHKADPNIEGASGCTPLIAAISGRHTEIVEMLLKNNANPNVTDSQGITPLILASMSESVDLVDVLLKNSANPNLTATNSKTPLIAAIVQNTPEIVDVLLQYGASMHDTFNGCNAMQWASTLNRASIVQVLLDHGADAHEKNHRKSEVEWSAIFGDHAVHEVLRKNIDSQNAPEIVKHTPTEPAVELRDPNEHVMGGAMSDS